MIIAAASGLVVTTPATNVLALAENDAFADATVVVGALPIFIADDNFDATAEPGEPLHAGVVAASSVWFVWAPESPGSVVIDTCSSDFDTVLAVYRGDSFDSLDPVASNDDSCGLGSQISFDVTSGDTLRIAVDGYAGAQGTFTLGIVEAPPPPVPPANDDFENATVLTGDLPIVVSGDSFGATEESGEPRHPWTEPPGTSVWFRWTADVAGPVTIDTCDPVAGFGFFDTLAVYTGPGLTNLALVEGDSGECSPFSKLTVTATPGVTYHIVLDDVGFGGQGGDYTLRIRRGAPPNDHLADAIVLDGPLPIVIEGSNVDATAEFRQPSNLEGTEFSAVSSGPDVWYAWTATEAGPVTVETCGSPIDTDLFVTTATTYAEWSLAAFVGANSDACGLQSRFAFDATAGTSYRIAVNGSEEGAFVLAIRAGRPTGPVNDDFANAIEIAGRLPVTVYGTNENATTEVAEPDHGLDFGGATIWYRWTAQSSALVAIEGCGVAFPSIAGVYTGPSLEALTPVATVREGGCVFGHRVVVNAVAGTTYWIAAGGFAGATGGLRVTVREWRPPSNDDFADAVVLRRRLPARAHGSNIDASYEPGEPGDYVSLGRGSSVWYRWVADSTGDVVVESCGSEHPTLVGIWTGPTVDQLEFIPDQAHRECTTDDTSIILHVVAGTTYHIAVDSPLTADDQDNETLGDVELAVRPLAPPSNDHFDGAITLRPNLPVSVQATNVDAGADPTDPVIYNPPGSSVWYRWTSPITENVVVDTCGRRPQGFPFVFTGDSADTLVLLQDPYPAGRSLENIEGCTGGGRFRFAATAGTTYTIMVDGVGNTGVHVVGPIELRIRRAAPPENDQFDSALPLRSRLPISLTVSNIDADIEAGEPVFPGPFTSVWYRWTPQHSGTVVVDTCGADFDTGLAVYTGQLIDELTAVASNDNWCADRDGSFSVASMVRFDAVAGTTYLISAGSAFRATRGTMPLRIRWAQPPANDDFADARRLIAPRVVAASNLDSTAEPGEPFLSSTEGRTVWFRWTPSVSTRVAIDTCDSSIGTALGVYTGDILAELLPVAVSGAAFCGDRSLVVFEATAGMTYSIAVAGVQDLFFTPGVEGDIRLRFHCADGQCT